MREKKRYLLAKFECDGGSFDEKAAKHLVYNAVFELLGEAGAARAGVQLKEFDAKKQLGAIKCQTIMLEKTIAALALKRFDAGKNVAIRLEKISGNIGKIWEKEK
ncbi:MAG: Rpp14/Pop5 family protein [Candidatus Micrarchaeia archaeon]|jgi:RNase P/RNase MRP subunit POP5